MFGNFYWPLFRLSFLANTLVFALLELWRPCYFLTDDNFTGGFPFLMEIGRHLLHGKSPFYSDYIFGGHYPLMEDATFFVWHPFYIIVSLLAPTPLSSWMFEILAYLFLTISWIGFITLADYLRSQYEIKLSDLWILFLTLSFNFSTYILVIGPGWINFLVNHGALPWITLGLLHRSWRMGLILVSVFTAHSLLGGHIAMNITTSISIGVFALILAVFQRQWRPLVIFILGSVAAVALVSPILFMMLKGFLQCSRSAGLTLETMSIYNIPWQDILPNLFAGNVSVFSAQKDQPIPHSIYYVGPTLASLAAWCLLPALWGTQRWNFLEKSSLITAGFLLLLIARPDWISSIMLHLPILKSLRWPFREVLQFQFFLHLFLLIRPYSGKAHLNRTLLGAGVLLFLIPLFFSPAPGLSPQLLDRKLYFSGKADAYWNKVRPLLQSQLYVPIVAIDPQKYLDNPEHSILLGSHNYPMLFQVCSATGYSATVPLSHQKLAAQPFIVYGNLLPKQKQEILQQYPHMNFITLESQYPLKITLSSADRPTIDLTSFLQP